MIKILMLMMVTTYDDKDDDSDDDNDAAHTVKKGQTCQAFDPGQSGQAHP